MAPSAVFTPTERKFLEALNASGVRFMLVGMGAAVLQGVYAVTEDVDIWFEELGDPRIVEAARVAGGIYVSGSFGMQQPRLGGDQLGERFDVVTNMSGLGTFAEEWQNTRVLTVDGLPLRLLRLQRIVASKRASGRPKDNALMPILEVALAALADGDEDT